MLKSVKSFEDLHIRHYYYRLDAIIFGSFIAGCFLPIPILRSFESNGFADKSMWISSQIYYRTFSFVFRVLLFYFHFYSFYFILFVLSLTFLQVADRSQVIIGIYPRGCVDRLLWFIISFISFYLVPYILDFVLSPIGSSRSFSLLLAIIGDGRSRPRSLSMVPAPPRGLYRLYLNPQHNWLCWVKWQWLFCPISI